MKKELTDLLKQIRISKNIKQEDVAIHLGVGKGTISNYENGKTEPDIDTFMKICNFYGANGTEILQKAYSNYGIDKSLNTKEQMHIKKYHSLNENGKNKVDDYINFVLSQPENVMYNPDFNELKKQAEELADDITPLVSNNSKSNK
ncbi:MAG: helix-turn-helix transcriptional regulator [Oscillospiraceae bacterium]